MFFLKNKTSINPKLQPKRQLPKNWRQKNWSRKKKLQPKRKWRPRKRLLAEVAEVSWFADGRIKTYWKIDCLSATTRGRGREPNKNKSFLHFKLTKFTQKHQQDLVATLLPEGRLRVGHDFLFTTNVSSHDSDKYKILQQPRLGEEDVSRFSKKTFFMLFDVYSKAPTRGNPGEIIISWFSNNIFI